MRTTRKYQYAGLNPVNFVDPSGLDVLVDNEQVQTQLRALLAQNPALSKSGTTAEQMYKAFRPGERDPQKLDLTILSRAEKSPIPAVTAREVIRQHLVTKEPCNTVFILLFEEKTRTDADTFLYIATELANAYTVLRGTSVGGDRGPTDIESNWFAVKAAAENPEMLKAARTGGFSDPRAAAAIDGVASGRIKTEADLMNLMNSR